ncbi:hypothetical protein VTN31DRAFT_2632 [Thermomyces dupontii]|uniref:uncharacterized protein n=1 Tax=Talaromyces thermophilus TaxID=28565 RepID=UPI0037423F01
MKISAVVAAFMASVALAQTLPPSPTESVGCEPHGDHWHCDGPAPTTSSSETTGVLPPSPTESVGCEPHGDHWHCDGPRPTGGNGDQDDDHGDDHDDDHDDDHSDDHDDHDHSSTGGVLPPSPTESVGCEPHGDHWHCDGPAPTSSTPAGSSSNVLPPSPTASVGCEPHGDHWHCDGPRTNGTEDETDDLEGPLSDDASVIPGTSGFVVGLAVLVSVALGL